MILKTADREFAIAQLGPDFLILADSAQIEAGHGEIHLSVDGQERHWPVRLPQSLAAGVELKIELVA